MAFFVFGFAKNDMANIEPENLLQLRKLARFLLSENEAALNKAVAEGKLIEVKYGKKAI